mmetsp:Transcript_58112/g.142065  ORF Transcript_58112/g.142065 Transcript_58112/m.142065 type:complete len:215 (+) Transcript_58112:1138-1782(+)
MTLLVELVSTCQPCWSRPDDGDRHTTPLGRDPGCDFSVSKGTVDDGVFDVLDGDRTIDKSSNARTLARRGTDPAGEFREVVCAVQPINRLVPLVLVDKVVPFGDQVVDGATGIRLTERRSAIHTPCSLDLPFQVGVGNIDVTFGDRVDLLPIHQPLKRVTVRFGVPLVVQKPTKLLDTLHGTITTTDLGFIVMVVNSFPPNFVSSVGSDGTLRR